VYTTKVDGLLFSDWLASLVNGESVGDVGSSLLKGGKPASDKAAKRGPHTH
jgi:hypothetical protein